MTRAIVLEKIAAAKQAIIDAESELKKVVREIAVAPRAEKTPISRAVEDAFTKLNTAKTNLGNLEKLAASENDCEKY
jgi:hypothetical protein